LFSKVALPPCIFVYGHTSTGKSMVISRILENLNKIHFAVVHSIEILTPRSLYESVLEQLGSEDLRCDNPNDFARYLSRVYDGQPICIIVDKAERLRDLNDGMM